MKSNTSADGPSINNMKTSYILDYYFYSVKAGFKNCIFSRRIWLEGVFLNFDNCSIHQSFHMSVSNNLFGFSYNIACVFFIRCTINNQLIDFYVKDVESQIHIVQSNLIHADFKVSVSTSVAHLTVHDSIINDTSITMVGIVWIVQITNTILAHTVVTAEGYRSVQAAFFIDNCTFISVSSVFFKVYNCVYC